jgi:ribosomal protein S18 acetylase RimI-like enzyme
VTAMSPGPPPAGRPSGSLEIVPADQGTAHAQFLDLPYRLHGANPHFVPPLRRDQRVLFDRRRHPFFRHAEVALFVARRAGRPVGRIEALVNHAHNEFHGDRLGFFGAFECEEDGEAARALVDHAAQWLSARNRDRMRGPTTHSTNEECGLLIDGFDDPPFVGMPYNPPYYAALLEGAGLEKAKDLWTWRFSAQRPIPDDFRRYAMLARRSRGITIRHGNAREYEKEVRVVFDLYNASWEQNWGFVPLTEAEFTFAADQLKPLMQRAPYGVLIAEVGGKPAGFCLAVADANQALIHLRDGRLFPFGFLRLAWGLRRMNRARLLALGIRREYRRLGLEVLLLLELFEQGQRHGFDRVEFGWVLEDNWLTTGMIERLAGPLGVERSRTYRLYDRVLG